MCKLFNLYRIVLFVNEFLSMNMKCEQWCFHVQRYDQRINRPSRTIQMNSFRHLVSNELNACVWVCERDIFFFFKWIDDFICVQHCSKLTIGNVFKSVVDSWYRVVTQRKRSIKHLIRFIAVWEFGTICVKMKRATNKKYIWKKKIKTKT